MLKITKPFEAVYVTDSIKGTRVCIFKCRTILTELDLYEFYKFYSANKKTIKTVIFLKFRVSRIRELYLSSFCKVNKVKFQVLDYTYKIK